MTASSLNPEQPPCGPLCAHQSASTPVVGPSRGSGGASGPQAGAEGFGLPEFIDVARYRHDHGHQAWAWRCWGDGDCDGWLALDKSSEESARQGATRHLTKAHPPATDQPVERMARFLAGAAHVNPQRDVPAWGSLDDADRDHYREEARRILRQTGVDGVRTTPDNPAGPLRDLYASAIREAACPGGCGATEEECRRQRIQPEVWHWGVIADVSGTPEQFADAVMAVRDQQLTLLRSLLTEAVDWIPEGELRERIRAALNPQEQS